MLLKKKRREKTLSINTIKIELITIRRYSNKRTLSEKTILNRDYDI